MSKILIYGAYGFVGEAISRLAYERGLNPVLAGRNAEKTQALAEELGLTHLAFSLESDSEVEKHIREFDMVMNCAGPYIETYKPMVRACIANNVHYLDISGEIPVYRAINEMASARGESLQSMALPGIGFDVAPTDCLALFLKENHPTGTDLRLAFKSDGPAALPPGTMQTMVTLIPFGNWIRRGGDLVRPANGVEVVDIPFRAKPDKAIRITWGDIYTAFYSTGIPNVEVFASFPPTVIKQMKFINTFRKLLSLPFMMRFLRKNLKGGSSERQRAKTRMHVYAELTDDSGKKLIGRLSGPEGGVIWTSRLAVKALEEISKGHFKPGYQTPASAFGPRFAIDMEEVEMGELQWN